MIRGVHTMFYTSAPEELRAFLRDRLRFPAHDVGDGWLIFDLPEADLGCHPSEEDAEDGAPAGTHDVSFYCDDVRATVAELRARGVDFEGEIVDAGYGHVIRMRLPGGVSAHLYEPSYAKGRKVRSTFQVTRWDEETFDEGAGGGPRLARASVSKAYRGALEGEGAVTYLMAHRADGTAAFTGLERVVGGLDGKRGSFLLEHRGTYENGIAKAACRVVAGSGAGGLAGLRGEGRFEARDREAPFDLEYEIGEEPTRRGR